MKKFLIIITFLFFLSMLNSCTIVRYDYKTKDSISNEELEDFQYFFKKFKNKLKENNGSKDFIQKYVNYYTLNLEFNKLGKKDYESSFIFLYTNFISLVSAEYNDICMLSLEKNKNIYRNKDNITWGIKDYYSDIILYRTSENKNEYPIGGIFRKNNSQWEIIGFVKFNK